MADTPLDDQMNNTMPPEDRTGNVAYTAHFRYYRALKIAASSLLAALLCAVAGNVLQARRPPVVLVVRVTDAGNAEAIRYDTLHYTPREAEIRARLNEWATYRFRLLKPVAGNFKLNYSYMESSIARRLMPDDATRVAKILAGTVEEQDCAINNIQFTSLDTRKLPDGAVASGEATIDLTKINNPAGSGDREHWTITLKYEVNPVQAALRSVSDPQFGNINPLGVTIVWFHEDRAFN